MSDDFMTGYVAGQGENRNNGFFGGDWGWIVLLLLFGWGGYGGGFGGFGGMGGNGAFTRAAIAEGFQVNGIDNGIRAIQNGLSDGFYAVQAQFANAAAQQAACCCETQRLIERGFCDVGYAMATNTSNIIQNSHSDTDRVIAKLDAMEQARMAEKLDALRNENLSLKFAASQLDQNAAIRASIDAATAEIIRRTGNECPIPAYVVPNPNCCYGNPVGVGYNGYGSNGCGCAA